MVGLYDIIILYYDKKIFFASLHAESPSQHLTNYVEANSCLLWLTQYLAADKVPCSMIEHSDTTDGASLTSNSSFPNLMLYQRSLCAPPKISLKDYLTL